MHIWVKVQFMVLGLPDSGTPRLQDSQTPGLPNSGTPKLRDSRTPRESLGLEALSSGESLVQITSKICQI